MRPWPDIVVIIDFGNLESVLALRAVIYVVRVLWGGLQMYSASFDKTSWAKVFLSVFETVNSCSGSKLARFVLCLFAIPLIGFRYLLHQINLFPLRVSELILKIRIFCHQQNLGRLHLENIRVKREEALLNSSDVSGLLSFKRLVDEIENDRNSA